MSEALRKDRHHPHRHHSAGSPTSTTTTSSTTQNPNADALAWGAGAIRSLGTIAGGASEAIAPSAYVTKEHKKARTKQPLHDGHTNLHPKKKKGGYAPISKSLSTQDSNSIQPVSFQVISTPYGQISDSEQRVGNLTGYAPKIDQLIQRSGYQVVDPEVNDFSSCNFNTMHIAPELDPTDEDLCNWRKLHELALGLTHPEVTAQYGEGKRVGAVGRELTLREALRAVTWKYMAMQKQRQLMSSIGVNLTDEDFNRQMNEVMADSVYRSITGEVPEQHLNAYSHSVPLEAALASIKDANLRVGKPAGDTFQKSEGIPRTLGQHLLNNYIAKMGVKAAPGALVFQPHPVGYGSGFSIAYRGPGHNISHDSESGKSSGNVQMHPNAPSVQSVSHEYITKNHPKVHEFLANASKHVAEAHDALQEFGGSGQTSNLTTGIK